MMGKQNYVFLIEDDDLFRIYNIKGKNSVLISKRKLIDKNVYIKNNLETKMESYDDLQILTIKKFLRWTLIIFI